MEKLQNLGVPAVSLSDIKGKEAKALEDGRNAVVYGTPDPRVLAKE